INKVQNSPNRICDRADQKVSVVQIADGDHVSICVLDCGGTIQETGGISVIGCHTVPERYCMRTCSHCSWQINLNITGVVGYIDAGIGGPNDQVLRSVSFYKNT